MLMLIFFNLNFKIYYLYKKNINYSKIEKKFKKIQKN